MLTARARFLHCPLRTHLVANANAASTTLTMPAAATSVTATYKAASSFTLTVDTVGVNLEDGGESTVKKVAAK